MRVFLQGEGIKEGEPHGGYYKRDKNKITLTCRPGSDVREPYHSPRAGLWLIISKTIMTTRLVLILLSTILKI